jgi:hypothetical protein
MKVAAWTILVAAAIFARVWRRYYRFGKPVTGFDQASLVVSATLIMGGVVTLGILQ